MAKSKSLNLWTFVIGGVVGGAIAYMGRGEIERLVGGLKNTTTQASRARRLYG